MADVRTLQRLGPLAAHALVAVTPSGAMTRLSARGGLEAARRIGRAFGPALPERALCAAEAEDRAALWLGPDEWLLLAPDDSGLAGRLEAALGGEPGCVVDISHRQIGLDVSGPGAAAALNAGCPLDLDASAFPAATSTRTVLAKADIVLWRRGPERFHLECWRSFAPYVLAFLDQAAHDNGAGGH